MGEGIGREERTGGGRRGGGRKTGVNLGEGQKRKHKEGWREEVKRHRRRV